MYATGGRGNARLITWEGEKTLTFTVEDALLSPLGLSILSGAGLIPNPTSGQEVHVHRTVMAEIQEPATGTYTIDIGSALEIGEIVCDTAPIFAAITEADGSITGTILTITNFATSTYGPSVDESNTAIDNNKGLLTVTAPQGTTLKAGQAIFVDFYTKSRQAIAQELQIDAEHFAGYYYVEADTLFRRQSDGVDMPAILTLPNVKIQSNFSFTMASSGDPSTFTFTMDAMPGYTYFDQTKKVLCVVQIILPRDKGATWKTVMPHVSGESSSTSFTKYVANDADSYVGK